MLNRPLITAGSTSLVQEMDKKIRTAGISGNIMKGIRNISESGAV